MERAEVPKESAGEGEEIIQERNEGREDKRKSVGRKGAVEREGAAGTEKDRGLEFAYKRVWDFIRIARVYLRHYKHFIAAFDGPAGTGTPGILLLLPISSGKRLRSDSRLGIVVPAG